MSSERPKLGPDIPKVVTAWLSATGRVVYMTKDRSWSENLAELKFMLRRSQGELSQHLLEDAEYREAFAPTELPAQAAQSPFQGRA